MTLYIQIGKNTDVAEEPATTISEYKDGSRRFCIQLFLKSIYTLRYYETACVYWMQSYGQGARGSVVSWDTMPEAWRSRVPFPIRSSDF
jgi:hypothetical protein